MLNVSVSDRKVSEYPALNVKEYPAGSMIFSEGRPGKSAFIVQSGIIEITKIGALGEVVIGYVGAGEILGEMAPIDNEPRMASAKALKDTQCIVITEEEFDGKLKDADPFVHDLLYVLVRALRSVTHTLVLHRDLS
jgi:CRP/FNR family transcriptional regulator, cyclic AMP receptor protein